MTLLPRNSSKLERDLEAALSRFDPAKRVPELWNGSTCPASMLPWLAWAVSVDDWDPTWGEERKRAAVNESIPIHEHKATPSAIMRAMAVRGHSDAILIERAACIRHNGEAIRNGYRRRGGPAMWATFGIILKRPITVDLAADILRMIKAVKRNCCHLLYMDYSKAALRHNGYTTRSGAYTRGLIS